MLCEKKKKQEKITNIGAIGLEFYFGEAYLKAQIGELMSVDTEVPTHGMTKGLCLTQ